MVALNKFQRAKIRINRDKQMKEENRKETNLSRAELMEQGYSACGNCKP